MSRIYRVFVHEYKKAVVMVDLDGGLMPLYYRAEDASFAHSALVCCANNGSLFFAIMVYEFLNTPTIRTLYTWEKHLSWIPLI